MGNHPQTNTTKAAVKEPAGEKRSSRLVTILLYVAFFVGLGLLGYPSLSDYWNSIYQSQAVTSYSQAVSNLKNDDYMKVLESARQYNEELVKKPLSLSPSIEEVETYQEMLMLQPGTPMAYIDVPKVRIKLPVYHGTEETTLQNSVGHLTGTSLPVGGVSTHCVLSAHRGLPSARLFTDIDQLVKGDTFILHTLDETLTYEVDRITIVLPEEIEGIAIVPGEDYCTLQTCTPYGINTHRLLVRGHRVDNAKSKNIRVPSDGSLLPNTFVAIFVALPILFFLLVFLLVKTRRVKVSRGEKQIQDAMQRIQARPTEKARERLRTLQGQLRQGQRGSGGAIKSPIH